MLTDDSLGAEVHGYNKIPFIHVYSLQDGSWLDLYTHVSYLFPCWFICVVLRQFNVALTIMEVTWRRIK
jgi:hypothetical protein